MLSATKPFAACLLTGALLILLCGGDCDDHYGYADLVSYVPGSEYFGFGYDPYYTDGYYYDDGYYYEEPVYYDDCCCDCYDYWYW